jgi:hypothetical protein
MSNMLVQEFRRNDAGVYVPFVRDEQHKLAQVSVAPLSQAQLAFLSAPEREVGLAGNRGGGKTETMMMDFLSGVGRGYGSHYKGVLIRQSHTEMTDLVRLSEEMIRPIWPKAQFNKLKNEWDFPGGEHLDFEYFDSPEGFGLFQGKNFIWIGFEELTLWRDLRCYFLMFSTLRSSLPPSVPRKVRFTCNPSGDGHNAVKFRFGLSGVPDGVCGPRITEIGKDGVPSSRRMIYCGFEDNVVLRHTEPNYMRDIEQACAGDEAKLRAWKDGDWSIVSGGAFDGIFFAHAKTIYEKPFDIPPSGRCFLAYDDGQTKPWVCLFLWENTEGCDIQFSDGSVRSGLPGDVHIVGECYGWSGKPDEGINQSIPEICGTIRAYEIANNWRWRDPISGKWKGLFKRGVADNAIFAPGRGDEASAVDEEFRRPVRIAGELHAGINFEPADKSSGSRVRGFTLMRERLIATSVPKGMRRREAKGLFVVADKCPHFVRTVPVLPRSKKNRDDVSDAAEDHIFDTVRYALTYDRRPAISFGRWIA